MIRPVDQRTELPGLPEPLPGPVVDTHCHLDITSEFSGLEVEDALERAASVGVTRVVQIGCDVQQSTWAVDLARTQPSVVAGVALHPNDAARLGLQSRSDLDDGLAVIAELATYDRVRVVGETGLDFFRTPDAAGQALQRESFAAHIAFAKANRKTLVIHDRDAHDAVLDVLDAEGVPDHVVMHCFSGDEAFARACLDRGAHLSFAGTVTFKANVHLRRALADHPARPGAGRDRRALPHPGARCAAGRTRRTWSRPPSGRWPRCAGRRWPSCAARSTRTRTRRSAGPGPRTATSGTATTAAPTTSTAATRQDSA